MAQPQRKHLPHSVPSWVEDGCVYFVTICCVPRHKNQLCVPEQAEAIFDAISFRQRRGDWWVRLVVLMPDHVHMLASFSREAGLRTVVANFKEIVAKRGAVKWQRDFFEHRLRKEESLDEKADYILMNPVRGGLVSAPEEWPYTRVASDFASGMPGGPSGPALPRAQA